LIANVGIVTARTISPAGIILFDAIKLNGFFQKNIITNKEQIETDYSQGSCLLINRDMINKTGLFDERFFLYWEEVDFSIRVRESGWKLISITTTSVIRNRNNITTQPLAFYYSIRNARLIREKHLNFFSGSSYVLYLVKMFFLMGKFIFLPKILFSVVLNYFSAIHDSYNKIYYSKPKKIS
jgi:GT2 family glycosyltransferase